VSRPPPEHVRAAAAVVESWVCEQESASRKVSDKQFAKMTPAQRLDYARQFPQDQFQKSNGRAV